MWRLNGGRGRRRGQHVGRRRALLLARKLTVARRASLVAALALRVVALPDLDLEALGREVTRH